MQIGAIFTPTEIGFISRDGGGGYGETNGGSNRALCDRRCGCSYPLSQEEYSSMLRELKIVFPGLWILVRLQILIREWMPKCQEGKVNGR